MILEISKQWFFYPFYKSLYYERDSEWVVMNIRCLLFETETKL